MQILRPELAELPPFMRDLKIHRGYPVPWFVDYVNGEPEFRAMDLRKFVRAVNEKLCWVCGNALFSEMIFVVGPMCALNRISSEPPSHRECARFSARYCPFLSRPSMERRESGLIDKKAAPGLMIERNPGVSLLWFARRYTPIQVPDIESVGAKAGILFQMGRPFRTEWYREGREATRAECLESINSGLPIFHAANEKQGIGEEGRAQVETQLAATMKLLPR
jgi:hypothetical protein